MASESQMSCVSDSNGNRVPRRGATRVLLLKDYPPEYIGRVGYHHPPLRRQLGKGCREVYFSKSGFRQHMIQHREHGDIERGPIDIAVYKRKFEKGEQGRVKLTRLDTGREVVASVRVARQKHALPYDSDSCCSRPSHSKIMLLTALASASCSPATCITRGRHTSIHLLPHLLALF